MISKEEFISQLSHCEVHLLQETLFRAEIDNDPQATTRQCAILIADELWKRTQSLWEKSFAPKSLDDIVDHYARQVDLELEGNAWQRLDAILLQLLPESSIISLEEIPEKAKEDFMRSPWIDRWAISSSSASLITSFLGKLISGQLHRIPLWLLKLIPWVGPRIILIRNAANVIARVTGPLGIAIALWTIYQQLGPKWDKALPLLLGSAIAIHHTSKLTPIEV